jgi:hypothetical protein
MLSSSSRNGFSDDGALVCHSWRKNPLTGSPDQEEIHDRRGNDHRWGQREELATNGTVVDPASRLPRCPTRVEVGVEAEPFGRIVIGDEGQDFQGLVVLRNEFFDGAIANVRHKILLQIGNNTKNFIPLLLVMNENSDKSKK